MSLLPKDVRYEYCRQLSLWVNDVSTLAHMTRPFEGLYPSAVIRRNNRGLFALFVRGPASQRTRYKLEVVLSCKVVVPEYTVRKPEPPTGEQES